jgi:hypothetical protein
MYSDVRERHAPNIIQTISSDLFIGGHGSKHHSTEEVALESRGHAARECGTLSAVFIAAG